MQLVKLASEQTAINALGHLLTKCEGKTNLWDAVVASCTDHIQSADKSKPWVLIVLTDGGDNGSKMTQREAIDVLRLFNAPTNNFTFFIGVGRDVDAHGLQSVCNESKSVYIPARDSGVLTVVFALIALQVRNIS